MSRCSQNPENSKSLNSIPQNKKPLQNKSQKIQHATGVINKGYDYESLMPALVALKLLFSPRIKDFSLDLNPASFKKFDDLIINVEYVDGNKEQFVVQLKHRDKGKDELNAQEELCGKHHYKKCKGKAFDILEYKEKYNEQNRFPQNCKVILFTNAKFKGINDLSDFKVEVREPLVFGKDAPNTTYQFKEKNEEHTNDKFYTNFYFLPEQKNTNEMRAAIEKMFKDKFHCSNATAICYMDFFHQLRIKNYKDAIISRDQLIFILIKLLLTPHIIRPTKYQENTEDNLIETAFKMFDLTVLSDIEEKFITDNWINKENLLDVKSKMTEVATNLKFIFSQNDEVKQNKEDKEDEKVERDDKVEVDDSLLQFVFYLQNKLLFLRVTEESEQIIASIVPFFKTLKGQKVHVVLVGNKINIQYFKELDIFQNLNNLLTTNKDLYEEITAHLKISLQGRESKSIKDFKRCDVDMDKILTPNDLFHILEGELLLGKKVEDLPEHHIPRTLFKSDVQINRLNKVCAKKAIVVHCHGKSGKFKRVVSKTDSFEITSMAAYEKETSRHRQPILILTDEEATTNDSFDHFSYENNSLKWIDSKIDVRNPLIFEINISLLFDETGTGKTTFMKYLAHHYPINYWVVFVPTQEISNILEKKVKDEEFITELMNVTDKTSKYSSCFRSKKRVVFLFDGLNELNGDFTTKALVGIKNLAEKGYKIWISGTSHLKNDVERIFMPAYYYTIGELSIEEQKKYITQRLRNGSSTEEDIVKITNQLCNIGISKTPLHLSILTDVSQKHNQNEVEANLNLSEMYRNFINAKIQHYLKTKMNLNLENTDVFLNVFKIFFWRNYQCIALKILLSQDIFQTLKNVDFDKDFLDIVKEHKLFFDIFYIKDNDKFAFKHETFADYFVAMWLIDNFENVPEESRNFILQSKYSGIKKFMDYELAQDLPLHLAVLNQDIDAVQKYASQCFNDVDKKGRTALHLAATLGRKYLNYNKMEITNIYSYKDDYKTQDEILKLLLEVKKFDLLQTDFLFGWNVFQYADASMCLLSLERLSKELSNQSMYMKTILNNVYLLPYHCVANGYLNLLKTLVDEDLTSSQIQDLNQIRKDNLKKLDKINGRPLLHVAIENHQQEMAMFLIEHGINMSTTNLQEYTHLHVAAIFGNHDIAKILLDKKVDVNAKDKMGRTALHHASKMGHPKVVSLLLEKGANVNCEDNYRHTPLHTVVKVGNLQILKSLLEYNSDINALTANDRTALHRASEAGHLDVVKELVMRKAKKDIKDIFEMTALHYAATQGCQDVVEYLIQQGDDPFATNEIGDTARKIAEEKGFSKIAEILTKAEKTAKRRSLLVSSKYPLHEAARSGNLDLLKQILNNGTRIEETNQKKETPLHIASAKGHLEIVKYLLANNANTAAKNDDDRVPLHLACQRGHIEVIKVLLVKGQHDARDKRGTTPIQWAAYRGYKEALVAFVDAGISLNLTTSNGRTPFISAAHHGRTNVMEYLLSLNADPTVKTVKGETSLHIAATKKQHKTVEFLLSRCKNIIDEQELYGKTALHLAVEENDKNTVVLLLNAGANTEIRDVRDQTAFEVARIAQRTEIIECFINYFHRN